MNTKRNSRLFFSLGIGLAALTLLVSFAAAATQIDIDGPSGSGQFGRNVTVLPNGNLVVCDPSYDSGSTVDVGAVYLYNGATGVLISKLTGSTAGDQIGTSQFGASGVTALSNGNYVVRSPMWDNGAVVNAGAVTWGSAMTGVSGVVGSANSLVGSTSDDQVGNAQLGTGGVTALSNGNYVVNSPMWDNGAVVNAGAVTWGSGTAGVSGVVSAANSLVGSTINDNVGNYVMALANGNFLVNSHFWDNGAAIDVGAVTWGSGTTSISGAVSPANSLVGSTSNDWVGTSEMIELANGNYVVRSPYWDDGATVDAGAVTWGSGTSGVSGVVSVGNSLVGGTAGDRVGEGVIALANGNYVVNSLSWDNGTASDAGAVTWGSGTSGVSGVVSATNSLVGSTANDLVFSVTALANGNYVVNSPNWDNGAATDVGAVTWGSGTTGISGVVSAANSLVGSIAGDMVGYSEVTELANGNYLVGSPGWHATGAATWGNGTSGISGTVSASNSLVGSNPGDNVGFGFTALANGNYVVWSPDWDNGAVFDAGAATWGSGTSGVTGVVSAANSLVGSTAGDAVGSGELGAKDGVTALTNGNYVVRSPYWHNGAVINAGAVTWGSGTSGVSGVVSVADGLVGSSAGDEVGGDQITYEGVTALANGNYVVRIPNWDNGLATNAGAVTWGSGTIGVNGPISAVNSLVGSANYDMVGYFPVSALANGNYVVSSPYWAKGAVPTAGAVTWGSGTSGVSGAVSAANSLVGSTVDDLVGDFGVTELANGNYVVHSPNWNNSAATDAGAATWGNGTSGISGVVSAANSLVGSTVNDYVGFDVTALANGNYIVLNSEWDNGAAVDAGAVTWGSGTAGVSGLISMDNSVRGVAAAGGALLQWVYDDVNQQLIVGRPGDNNVTLFRPNQTNQAPLADAGIDQFVKSSGQVILDGSGSNDPESDYPLTYLWVQSGGPTITLSDNTAINPTFSAPATFTQTVALTITLVVTNSLGLASQPDQVIITVEPYRMFLPITIK